MRVAVLRITPELFVEFCKACQDGPLRSFVVTANALPADATVINLRGDPNLELIELLIQSETFDELPEGQAPPTLDPVVFRTDFRNPVIQ